MRIDPRGAPGIPEARGEPIDRVIEAARAETRARTLPVTRRFLGQRSVVVEDGVPTVACVRETAADSWDVHFAVRGRTTRSLVVSVRMDADGTPSVHSARAAAEMRAYARITSRTVTGAEIASRIGIDATRIVVLGEPWFLLPRRHEHHAWILEPEPEVPGDVTAVLRQLLDVIRPAAPRIVALGPECTVAVVVVYDGWRGDPQYGAWDIGPDLVELMARLGASLDFDLYLAGEIDDG